MARAEGDPVPYEHQFYRAHLKAPLALDLTNAGTFFVSKRVGYKNLDKNRIESALAANATTVNVRGFEAYRLPLATRRERVAQLLVALGRLEGGAKQTLHLTDTSPAILVLAICKSGNQPFQRLFTADDMQRTTIRLDVLDEALAVFKDDLQSDLYIGWAKGFLDTERSRLEAMIKDSKHSSGRVVHVGHPRDIAEMFAAAIAEDKNASWFD
jgi:CRISPR-associated protein Cst2